MGVGTETGEAPKRNQLCDGFLASQLLDSAGVEGRGAGGGVDRPAEPGQGAPINGEGLRLRVYSIRSLRGRKAPSFTASTPPTPGSQHQAKVEGATGGFDLLADTTTPTQSMQDRQIHVIFAECCPWGHAGAGGWSP